MTSSRFTIFIFLAMIALTGCMGTRHLQEDQYVLYKHKVEGNKRTSSSGLLSVARQRPNKKTLLPFLSLNVWFYQTGLNKFDSAKLLEKRSRIIEKYEAKMENAKNARKKEKKRAKMGNKLVKIDLTLEQGNQFMRWGEPLAIYDSSRAVQSVDQMVRYMNARGHFNASADFRVRKKKKRAYVTYTVEEGPQFKVDSIYDKIDDPNLMALIRLGDRDSHLKPGEPYSQEKLTRERDRLTEIYRNNGYFTFNKQYVRFTVDTTLGNARVAIGREILNPARNKRHKLFIVDSVIFVTDSKLQPGGGIQRLSETYRNVTYQYYSKRYSKKVLDQRLYIYPGDLYSRKNTLETQTQLAVMDIFRFINIKYDTTGGRFIANIYSTALDKYQFSNEIGFNVSVGLPGPFYNFSIKNRNPFKGLEILQLSGGFGLEGVASATNVSDVYSSTEFNVNLSLIFPQFIVPLPYRWKYKIGRNPKTQIKGGFNYLNRPEYKRNNIFLSYAYFWQNRKNTLFNLTLADINVINTVDVDPEFQGLLDDLRNQGNNLWRSFEPSFVSSILFGVTFNFNQYGNFSKKASYLRILSDVGGLLQNFYGDRFLEDRGLETYRYVKLNLDYRFHKPLPRNTWVAFKLNMGFAYSYGENPTLPYEKFFFIGGSNSVRAWRPRRLGPGSFVRTDSITGEVDDSFEQPGDILLEASIELRKKVVGFFETALFIDAGNIWALREDEQRPGAQFQLKEFYKQIAVGTGLGLRFNFDFLIVRLDAGLKFYDPARERGKRTIFRSGFKDFPFNNVDNVILNLGVGYPF